MSEKILTPEEYAKRHKESFRCAFDFLNSHFPPSTDPDWWLKAAEDVSNASISCGENRLVIGLLMGVYDYLDEEYKLRRKKNGEADS